MKTTRFLLAALACTACIISCNPDKPDNNETSTDDQGQTEQEKDPEKTPSIKINTEERTFTLEAKSEGVSFQVLANYDWTLTKTNLDWAEVTPASGTADDLVTVKVVPQDNTETVQREGSFKIAIPNKDCEVAFTVIQGPKGEVKPVVVAKWQFTALWVNEEASAPTNKTNPNTAGAAMATAWQNGTPVASNVVAGGSLSFVTTSSTVKYTMGPATHKKNRFRAANLNKDDYFLFTLDAVDVETNEQIRFRNAFIQIANVNKGPGKYAVEASLDKTNWTLLKEVQVDNTSAGKPASLDCEYTSAAAYKGPYYLRIRIMENVSANGTELTEGSEKLPILSCDDASYPSTNSYDVRDAYYEDDWAFVYFDTLKAE